MAPIEITIVLVYKKPPASGPSWSRTVDSQHAPDRKSSLKIASQNGRTRATPISHTHYWSNTISETTPILLTADHAHHSSCLVSACRSWQSVFGWTWEWSRERERRTRHWYWKTALGLYWSSCGSIQKTLYCSYSSKHPAKKWSYGTWLNNSVFLANAEMTLQLVVSNSAADVRCYYNCVT